MRYRSILTAALCAVLILGAIAVSRYQPAATQEEPLPISPRIPNAEEPYIRIGFYGSLTGSASLMGQMGQLGCRLAVDQINNSGGINGKKIRFIEYDDQSDPVHAEEVVRRMLTEDRVDAIIGSHTSGNVARTAHLTEEAQVLQIALGTSYEWTDSRFRYLFSATGNSTTYDAAILEAMREADHTSIAIYYDSSEYAQTGALKLRERIQYDPDMEVVWSHRYERTETEFLPDLREMLRFSPDAVILYTSTENAGLQLKELRESAGYEGTVYATEVFAASSTRQEAGESLTDVVFPCTNMIPASPSYAFSEKEHAFLESYIKMYGTMPVADTAYRGYDAMMLLAETFRTAENMENETLCQALLELTDYEGISGVFDFSDGSGSGLHSCRLVTVKDSDHISMMEYTQPY